MKREENLNHANARGHGLEADPHLTADYGGRRVQDLQRGCRHPHDPWAAQGRFLNVTQPHVPTSKMGSRGNYPAGSGSEDYCRLVPGYHYTAVLYHLQDPFISSEEPSGEMHVLKGGDTRGLSQSQAGGLNPASPFTSPVTLGNSASLSTPCVLV